MSEQGEKVESEQQTQTSIPPTPVVDGVQHGAENVAEDTTKVEVGAHEVGAELGNDSAELAGANEPEEEISKVETEQNKVEAAQHATPQADESNQEAADKLNEGVEGENQPLSEETTPPDGENVDNQADMTTSNGEIAIQPSVDRTATPSDDITAQSNDENMAQPSGGEESTEIAEGMAPPTGEVVASPSGEKAASPSGEKAASPSGETAASPSGNGAATPSNEEVVPPTGDGSASQNLKLDINEIAADGQDIHTVGDMTTPQPSAGVHDPPAHDQSRFSTPGIPPLPTGEESKVTTATARNSMLSRNEDSNEPLNLEWTFGLNRKVPCIDLSDGNRTVILYAAANVALLYDFKHNVQKILQGHGNSISCMDCSEDKRWVATGDKGQGSCVIIWDTYTGIPVQTIFSIHDDAGVVALAMSPDAKYIVTLSATTPQTVCLWDWTESSDEPLHSIDIHPTHNLQTYVTFHPTNNHHFVTNSESQVLFHSWESGTLKQSAPFLSDTNFNRAVGLFSQTIFLDEPSRRAFTATSLGNIVVWDPERPNGKNGGTVGSEQKRALKLVRVKDRSLTCLTRTQDLVVTGDTAGHVRFYDNQLNLINWYQDLKVGTVTGVSFRFNPAFRADRIPESNKYPDDATIAAKTFAVNDFVVSTKSAEVIRVETDGSKVTLIFNEHDSAVNAIAASPIKPWLCVGSHSGVLKVWDYIEKKVVVTRVFENRSKVQSVAYNHNGLQLAVGMTSGLVVILDAISLVEEASFHYASDVITHCSFSHNSRYLATADGGFTTSVFIYDDEKQWKYLGRYKAHYDVIQDLSFGIDLDSNQPRLLTLGKDRVLVEYNLSGSHKDDLKLLSVERIEQSALPLSIEWYPPVTKESFLVIGNNHFKMKLFNSTTKMCRKTLLGPTYGSPVRLMSVVPPAPNTDPSTNRLLAYATDNKVGLQLLPLDGNPHRSVSTIAHPSGVSRLTCSNDGKFIFTTGGKDASVHMWSINQTSLRSVAALGGEDLIPFYGLLEGGRDGEMFGELENYFYFAQLRSQGLNATEERAASTVVQLDQVPYLMRALGFYPSEQEIEDMLNEVKFSRYVDSGEYVDTINLGSFIKLYINHRPAFGLSPDEICNAFDILGRQSGGDSAVDRSELLGILQRKGEHMTEHELAECLTSLLGFHPEGGLDGGTMDYEAASKDLEEALPEFVTANLFASEVLGLNLYDTTS